MKKFKILPLLLALLMTLSLLPVSALAVSDPEIGAKTAIIVDTESGEVYYEKSADKHVQPASTTKMMTTLLVVEAVERGELALSDSVTASSNASYNLEDDSTDATPRIQEGEALTVENLLYCVMLASANEACNILAEHLSGTVSAFVDKMNERAEELGCSDTHFTNANGLEDPDHYSSAADLARIAREALGHPLFAQVCGTYSYVVPETNVSEPRELENSNKLLDHGSDYYYDYAYGVKTGFFTNAGYCLVSAAEKNDMDVVCVVMGSPELGDQFLDSRTLLDWFFDNYEYRQILSSAETLGVVPVDMGTSDTVGVRAEDVISVVLPRDFDITRVVKEPTLYNEGTGQRLEAPVNAGEALGEITVSEVDENGSTVRVFGTSRLVAASSVEMSRKEYLRAQIMELFQEPIVRRIITILIVILAVYFLLVLFYYIQRVRHVTSVRRAKKERAMRQTAEEAQWLSIPEEPDEDPGIGYFSDTPVRESIDAPAEEEPEDNVVAFTGRKAADGAKTETPRHRVPRNELTDDDFFDSFFKN